MCVREESQKLTLITIISLHPPPVRYQTSMFRLLPSFRGRLLGRLSTLIYYILRTQATCQPTWSAHYWNFNWAGQDRHLGKVPVVFDWSARPRARRKGGKVKLKCSCRDRFCWRVGIVLLLGLSFLSRCWSLWYSFRKSVTLVDLPWATTPQTTRAARKRGFAATSWSGWKIFVRTRRFWKV